MYWRRYEFVNVGIELCTVVIDISNFDAEITTTLY